MRLNWKRALCLAAALLVLLPLASGLAADHDKVINNQYGGDWQPIPKSYVLKTSVSYLNADLGALKQPNDLDIGPNGHIYIADTGNNRIVELDEKFQPVAAYKNEEQKKFRSPQGVFVDEYGAIFVADTDNSRVVKMSSSGKFVEEFKKPTSAILGDNFNFTPRKVAVSSTGYLYAIRLQWLMQIDAQGKFCGYIGTNQVGFDLWYRIRQLLSNERQRIALQKREPSSIRSFDIVDSGALYVTTAETTAQLKKINSVGKNIYPFTGKFGYTIWNDQLAQNPIFSDVAVNDDEIVCMLEEHAGELHIYDPDGNNLTIFGGLGEGSGRMSSPVAVEIDNDGCVYVVDQKRNALMVFEPTYMMQQVLQAVKLYADGRYTQAAEYWQTILDIDSNFTLANAGLAKAYFKQGEYGLAMKYYRFSEDKLGYSQAFSRYKTEIIRNHFPIVVLCCLAVIVVLILIVKFILWYTRTILRRYDSMI